MMIILYLDSSFCFHLFFFFNDTATTEIYTLSLHDALPISFTARPTARCGRAAGWRCRMSAPAAPANRIFRCLGPPPYRKSTRLNSSHVEISYAVFCLKKKNRDNEYHAYILCRKLGQNPL